MPVFYALLVLLAQVALVAGCAGTRPRARPPAEDGAASDMAAHREAGPWDLGFSPDRPGRDALVDRGVSDGPIKPDGPKPDLLSGVTLLVNLGDSLAAGCCATTGLSYSALLLKNNDTLYPTYKGRDLSTRLPSAKWVDRSKGGAVTKDVVAQAKAVTGNPQGNTLVAISAGGNDFNDSLETIVNPLKAAAAASAAQANLKQVIAHFTNKTLFPGKVTILLLTVHDPTDGKGSIPSLSGQTGFCKTIASLGALVGPVAIANLATFNKALGSLASPGLVIMVPNHDTFLGHGMNYQDKTWKHYKSADPTLWFYNDCIHLNNRGHHEIRRLIWAALTGETF